MQSLFTGSSIRQDWRVAEVIPFYKSSERFSPLMYPPISLTSAIYKLMKHIVPSLLINYLEDHSLMFKYPHGFRKGYYCETQLAGFLQDLYSSIDIGFEVDAVFYFSKAFDRVPHYRLLAKLSGLNIHPHVLQWITDFMAF